jgi:DEAD/DEAH box helicase domain-containing protein
MTTPTLALRTTDSLTRIREIVEKIAAKDTAGEVLTAIRHFPAREAEFADFPDWAEPALAEAYAAKGITRLYSHQRAVADLAHERRSVVVVTPTASGKTICYNLPALNAVLQNTDTRALYLFPTKALAQDQLAELHDLARRLDDRFGVFTYDGDTPADARKAIREKGHIVLSNPDMLHTGILPHHTRWQRLFENLQFVVLDELHTYRGVFGSHLCNVLRRLRRIANFYGSHPKFICSSATIANPGALAAALLEEDVEVVEKNGAPAGEKLFVFYNPPVINKHLGIRRSYINETSRLAQEFLKRGLQTMVFANSRLNTEILLTYLQRAFPAHPVAEPSVRGYRGGYLPGERREIESKLRDGTIRGVVTTSALELGIDVGSLDAVVMAGYAGTIASTWQRAGRAGRRSGTSCAVMVASSAPLDQFIARNPEYFFERSPEHGYIQPDNLEILVNHLKCAAFELPITPEENFGDVDLPELCAQLESAGFLHRSGTHWHWTQEAYPADTVSLRSVTSDNFVIVDITREPRVLGEVDFSSALTTVHPKAIYLHQGEQFHVEKMDFDERKAYVRAADVDYYTDAIRYTQVRILEIAEQQQVEGARGGRDGGRMIANAACSHGDVLVRSQVIGFKKIKFFTHENVGSGELQLPENEMHTTACWFTLQRALVESLPFAITDRQHGILGLLYALHGVATLLVMCDARDLGTAIGERPPAIGVGEWAAAPDVRELARNISETEFFEPNLYLYDAYPGGIGFSEALYHMHGLLLRKTYELISRCECAQGCPSCVGPASKGNEHSKEVALRILELLGAV